MAVQLDGLREAIVEHEKWAKRARNMQPVLDEIAWEAQRLYAESWAQRQSPAGVEWPPLKEERRAKKEPKTPRRGRRRTRNLQTSGNARAGRKIVFLNNGVRHASFQYYGTKRGLPARMPWPAEIVDGHVALSTSGRAGEWFAKMQAKVEAYLAGETAEGAA